MGGETGDEKTIFNVACSIESPQLRRDYLHQVCGDRPQMLERITVLLRAHFEDPDFLAPPARSMAATLDFAASAERRGAQIGPYKLVEEIGEGGMGTVYLATQKEPVRRKVALKVIKPGMDSKQVVSRFEAERQALAMMDHPNIAKVHDGGSTESGLPYFVMELVNGIPITAYSDRYRLTNKQRLELFQDVCRAVQHAHQKGIIHRDLKPSNILVTLLDGQPVPKVIDFGIAKAISGHLTEASLVTNFAQMVGTPLYMSPEQAELSGTDVDTRSDVYSLGVLLYELLTGTTPFDRKRMNSVSFDEFRRIVREEEPPRPSTRVSTLDAALTTVAEKHHTDPRTLCHQMRGELDWIVMKALEKDRTRRYESANELAKDIDRHLHDQPVEACPPSKVYRFGKFARRHRAALISGMAVLLSAIIVLVGITLASLSQRKLADHRRKLADQRLQVQQEINNALTEVARLRGQFQAAGQDDQPAVSRAREQAQRALALAEAGPADPQLLAQVQQLNEELDQEQRDRQLLAALDRAWLAQAQTEASQSRFLAEAVVPQLEEALLRYGITVGKDDPRQTASLVASKPSEIRTALVAAFDEWRQSLLPPLGVLLSETSGGNVIVASVVKRAADDIQQGDRLVGVGQGEDHQIVDVRARSLAEVETLLLGEAGTIVQMEVISPGHTQSRICKRQRDPVAAWLRKASDLADPDPWRRNLREAMELQDLKRRKSALEELAEEADVTKHPTRLLVGLANRLQNLGGGEKAIHLLKRVRAASPGNLWANAFLGDAFDANSQHEESLRYRTVAVALYPNSAGLRLNLGLALAKSGREEEAIAEFDETIRLEPQYSAAHANLGFALVRMGKLDQGISEFREAIRIKPLDATHHYGLGVALAKQGKWQEAIAANRESLRLQPDFVPALNNLGAILCDVVHDFPAAETTFRNALALQPENARYHANLARALHEQAKLDEALAACREAMRLAPEDSFVHEMLGNMLSSAGRVDEAIVALREAIRLQPDSVLARSSLAFALFYHGEIDEAQREIREAIRLNPDSAWAHGFLSWCLASPNKSDRKPQDIEQAISHARKAVELAGQDPLQTIEGHTSLGIAYYRKGTLDQAATHLTKVIELERATEHKTDTGKLDRAICMFFLAMTSWQADKKDEARRWYDDAATWMKENKPDNPDLLRFRAEAADLLGIKEKGNDETQSPERIDAKSDMPKETPTERDESN